MKYVEWSHEINHFRHLEYIIFCVFTLQDYIHAVEYIQNANLKCTAQRFYIGAQS